MGVDVLDPWRLRLLSQLESLGTVRAVAVASRLSPSSVSQQLSVLEREVDAKLYERAGRRLRLTPAGVTLVRHARIILDQMDAARSELVSLANAPVGRVRIGAFTSAVNTFVIGALGQLREQFPQLRVNVWELDPADSLPALRRGDCDVVVTADSVDGSVPIGAEVVHTPLAEDDIVLVSGTAQTGPIDLADFGARQWAVELPGTWSYDLVTRACRKAGFEPDIAGQFASYGPLLAHVEAGLSVTLLPELAVDRRYRVVASPLRDPMRRTITAAVRASSVDRPAVNAVVAALREAAIVGP